MSFIGRALALEMQDNDAGADTIKEYLLKLLEQVWIGGEGFSGKRPFGNSSWEHELYVPLVMAGFVEGELDEYQCINYDNFDEDKARKIILDCIKAL